MLHLVGRWSVRHSGVVIALAVSVALLSTASWRWLDFHAVARRDAALVRVEFELPGETAEALDQRLAQPLERLLLATDGVAAVDCMSRPDGTCELTVEMQPSIDRSTAVGLVQASVEGQLSSLASLPRPRVVVTSIGQRPAVIVCLFDKTGRVAGAQTLARHGEQLRSELEALPAIARVEAVGPRPASYRARLDPARLERLGVSAQDAIEALSKVERASAKNDRPEGWKSIAISTGTSDVRLGEVARLAPSADLAAAQSQVNRMPCVTLLCYAEDSATALGASQEVSDRLLDSLASLPSHLGLTVMTDEGALAMRVMLGCALALAAAIVLCVLVCFLVTANVRLCAGLLVILLTTEALTISGHVLLGMPLTLGSVAALWIVLTLSVAQLFQLAWETERAQPDGTGLRATTVLRAWRQCGAMFLALTCLALGASSTVLAIDLAGSEVLRPFFTALTLGLVVTIALFVTVYPATMMFVYGSGGERRMPIVRIVAEGIQGLSWSQALIARGLVWQPLVAVVACLSLLGWFLSSWGALPLALLPAGDQSHFFVDIAGVEGGEPLAESGVVQRLVASLQRFPEVDAVAVLPGYAAARDRFDPHACALAVRLRHSLWKPAASASHVAAWAQRSLPQSEEVECRLVLPGLEETLASTKELAVRFVASDSRAALEAPVQRFVEEASAFSAAVETAPRVSAAMAGRAWMPKAEALERYGAAAHDVQLLATLASRGELSLAGGELELVVDLERADAWRELPVQSNAGRFVPLASLVEQRIVEQMPVLARHNARPSIDVRLALPPGTHDAHAASAVDEALAALPLGAYRVDWIGRGHALRQWQAAFREVGWYVLIGVILIVLAVCFVGYADFALAPVALVVMMLVPLTLTGAAVGLQLRRSAIDPLAAIALWGALLLAIAYLLMLIVAMQRRGRAGDSISVAAAFAIQSRAMPLMLITLIVLAAYAPLCLLPGPAAVVRQAIGLPALCGVVSTGLFVPLLAPSLLVIAQWGGERLLRRKSVEDVWRFGESLELGYGLVGLVSSLGRKRRKHTEDMAGPIAIVTVTGPIKPGKMGTTLTQERLFTDLARRSASAAPIEKRAFTTLYDHVTNVRIYGGHTIVDGVTAAEGRNPILLRDVSKATGVRIMTNTGCTAVGEGRLLPSYFRDGTVESVAELWINEWRTGIDVSGVRAGFIKIGFDETTTPALYEKLCAAAAIAHLESGMSIASDTPDATSAQRQLDWLQTLGVNANAWIWLHAQREANRERLIEIAKQGAWIEIDDFSHSTLAARLDLVRLMQQEGVIDRLLVSQHTTGYVAGVGGQTSRITRLDRVFKLLIPELFRDDFLLAQIRQITVINPSRAYMTCVRRSAHAPERIVESEANTSSGR